MDYNFNHNSSSEKKTDNQPVRTRILTIFPNGLVASEYDSRDQNNDTLREIIRG